MARKKVNTTLHNQTNLPIPTATNSSQKHNSSMLKLKSFKKIKRMKLKQRFAILVVFIIVLFTTRTHWIPHLRVAGFFKGDYYSDYDIEQSPHAEKHADLLSSIKRHAGHERGDKIKVGDQNSNSDNSTLSDFGELQGPEHIDRSAREQAKKKEVSDERKAKKAVLEEKLAAKRAERLRKEQEVREKNREADGVNTVNDGDDDDDDEDEDDDDDDEEDKKEEADQY